MTAIGAILGLRFKVFVLVPAIAISSIGNLAMGIGLATAFGPVCLPHYLAITALQIGLYCRDSRSFWCREGPRP